LLPGFSYRPKLAVGVQVVAEDEVIVCKKDFRGLIANLIVDAEECPCWILEGPDPICTGDQILDVE
jgi:hypothetical protein